MNVWLKGPVTRNPYVRTAFRVAMVPREVVRRPSLVKRIAVTRRIASSSPEMNSILGVPVTLEEINAAEAVLLNPEERILVELLVHETETRDLRAVRSLVAEVEAAGPLPEAETMAVRPAALRVWMEELLQQCLEEQPAADPEFGGMEMDITPPFGETSEAM